MGYRRSAPTFSFMGNDRLTRTVDLVVDDEVRAAQIEPRRPRVWSIDGTVPMTVGELDHGLETHRVHLVVAGRPPSGA